MDTPFFLFTGSTTLALDSYRPEERDRAQAALNFYTLATLALTSLASGVLITSQSWALLNYVSVPALALMAGSMFWLARKQASGRAAAGAAL